MDLSPDSEDEVVADLNGTEGVACIAPPPPPTLPVAGICKHACFSNMVRALCSHCSLLARPQVNLTMTAATTRDRPKPQKMQERKRMTPCTCFLDTQVRMLYLLVRQIEMLCSPEFLWLLHFALMIDARLRLLGPSDVSMQTPSLPYPGAGAPEIPWRAVAPMTGRFYGGSVDMLRQFSLLLCGCFFCALDTESNVVLRKSCCPPAFQAGAQDGYTCELRGHTDTVSATAFSGDGSLLATAGLDGMYG